MRVKIHSSEINRMMKTIVQCVDEKFDRFSNIEIKHENNLLTIRATDGTFYARASAPVREIWSDAEEPAPLKKRRRDSVMPASLRRAESAEEMKIYEPTGIYR